MKPVNNKSLLGFIFDQMEKLDNDQIDVEKAKAQANLAKQANNALRYELDLVKTKISIRQHNVQFSDNVELRNAESKNFE
jgi:hypothetical protein